MNLLDMFEGREPHQQAIDKLEQSRIDHLKEKMDYYAKHGMLEQFRKAKEEHDSYFKVQDECMGYGGVVGEAGIGQDIANKQEKMARATPSTPASKVASTVKNAAKWLAGKGGPGREGPTYEDQKKNSKVAEGQRLHVGDPIIVTAPNEFEGKTGEISEFSPSGKFVIVNLYNHGEHSMHLSDVEYNQYADTQDEEDDWYDNQEDTLEEANVNPKFINAQVTKILAGEARRMTNAPVAQLLAPVMSQYGLTLQQIDSMVPGGLKKAAGEYGIMMKEGWSNKMVAQRTGQAPTPYSVYIKGKEWKSFADDDHAENVANKLRAKFKQEGKDPGVITIAPTGYDKGMDEALSKKDLLKQVGDKLNDPEFRKKPADPTKRWEKGDLYQGPGPDDYGYTGYQGHGMPTDKAERARIRADKKKGVAEAETDYSKRRQREKDIDAGKPVAKQRQPKMTDYQRRRAQQKKEMELGEDDVEDFLKAGGKITYGKPQKGPRRPGLSLASRHIGGGGDKMRMSRTGRAGAAVGAKPVGIKEEQDTSGVESAIIRRIMVAHTDLLKQFGPEKVMQAAEEVAYNVGDVDEIGTSDVSAYVEQVKQILGA